MSGGGSSQISYSCDRVGKLLESNKYSATLSRVINIGVHSNVLLRYLLTRAEHCCKHLMYRLIYLLPMRTLYDRCYPSPIL